MWIAPLLIPSFTAALRSFPVVISAFSSSNFKRTSGGTIILLQNETHTFDTGLSSSASLTIQPYCTSDEASVIGSVSGGSEKWISHSSGTLTLNAFTLRVTSSFSSSYTLVCVTSSGTLTVNGMRFNCSASYSTYNKPLIDASTKYLTFSGTSSFNSIDVYHQTEERSMQS